MNGFVILAGLFSAGLGLAAAQGRANAAELLLGVGLVVILLAAGSLRDGS